jgi:hypothetical protein
MIPPAKRGDRRRDPPDTTTMNIYNAFCDQTPVSHAVVPPG